MHEFDFANKKWNLLQAKGIQLMKARFAYTASIAHGDNKVYIYGGSGVDGNSYYQDVLAYDTTQQ